MCQTLLDLYSDQLDRNGISQGRVKLKKKTQNKNQNSMQNTTLKTNLGYLKIISMLELLSL